ncbi:helix-turn-helix domain-containing protein [Methanocella arvoryzae]|nr:helix-turn-helix domain-containing protein [Methanocella arvoryzae]
MDRSPTGNSITISIGIKHHDCWHYKLSKGLNATILVRYTYVLPNRQLYGYQTIVTPALASLGPYLAKLPEIRRYSILSRGSGRAEVVTWAEQSSILEHLLKTNCVFIGPTVIRDGIENWQIMAPSRVELQEAIASLEKHAEIAYIRSSASAHSSEGLTERQTSALTAAVEMGYFDSPRRASIEDVAARLGISASTAVEHLRKAEKKVLEKYVHPV